MASSTGGSGIDSTRRRAKDFTKKRSYEINIIVLFLVGMATLIFTWNSHKKFHQSIDDREVKLDGICPEGGDSCLEFREIEDKSVTRLLDEDYMSTISSRRSSNCSGHGFQDVDGDCQCAILYKGSDCSKSFSFLVRLPNAWQLHVGEIASTRGFSGLYDGDFIMNQNGFPGAKEKRHVYEQVALQRYTLNKDGSVMRRLEVIGAVDKPMYQVLPEEDPLRERVFNRCAVVGSSGVLLNRLGGEIIDNYHMVVRFNRAPTEGFSRQVGSKTTFRIVSVDNLDFQEGDESVIVRGLSRDMLRDRKWFSKLSFGKRNRLLILSPDFENYVAKSVVEFEPSEGLLGALLALQMCRQVHLYGYFIWEKYGSSPYHYYDTCAREEDEDLSAAEELEWKFLKSLAVGRLLSFGETCVLECRESDSACDQCRQDDPTYQELVPGDVLDLRKKAPKPNCTESDIDYETQAPN